MCLSQVYLTNRIIYHVCPYIPNRHFSHKHKIKYGGIGGGESNAEKSSSEQRASEESTS